MGPGSALRAVRDDNLSRPHHTTCVRDRAGIRLSDDVRARAAPYTREAVVTLAAGQVLVIDFDAEKGGITLQ